MQWSEVRRIFPDKFVLLKDLKSHVENGHVVIEEVAVIRPLADGKEVTKELRNCKGAKFIYHTSKANIVVPIHTKLNIWSQA
jgi:hypothetical protein